MSYRVEEECAKTSYPHILPTFEKPVVYEEQYENQHDFEREKRHRRLERVGELGAVAAGAFGVYELHKAKADPENCKRHNTEAAIAGAVALGSGGYAIYEHLGHKKIANECLKLC